MNEAREHRAAQLRKLEELRKVNAALEEAAAAAAAPPPKPEKKERAEKRDGKRPRAAVDEDPRPIQHPGAGAPHTKASTSVLREPPVIEAGSSISFVLEARRKKTGLEARIDAAIKAGEFQLADRLNDELMAAREELERREEAERQEFTAKLQAQADEKAGKKKKKKKLDWGFGARQRWELKANM